MAMAVKFYEMKRLSSGMAAQLAGISRVELLLDLHSVGCPERRLTTRQISNPDCP
jgi:predicted HTH domain antitoxin